MKNLYTEIYIYTEKLINTNHFKRRKTKFIQQSFRKAGIPYSDPGYTGRTDSTSVLVSGKTVPSL